MDVKIIVETQSQMQTLIEQLRCFTDQEERTDESRRRSWRLMYAAHGVIDYSESESDSNNEPIYITTRDISPTGLGFLTKQELQIGQKLIIFLDTDFGQVEITCHVVHCTPTIGMYKTGVKFDLLDPEFN